VGWLDQQSLLYVLQNLWLLLLLIVLLMANLLQLLLKAKPLHGLLCCPASAAL
jgi:hypothetical protein